eukprot:CAMPEP_0116118596 /NCGR_PEP_ID=MMETSP0329-20121206/2188_1 /TAXON_ID=697910 /ORGANISM="Pseudo-nitzschia arenysensis, Strain B593" /LENGTH=391 /DNA_ID=CAMNT_0003612233 /DNA_START=85 /DNA_END=1260 /DNA_ORIENTATION=-
MTGAFRFTSRSFSIARHSAFPKRPLRRRVDDRLFQNCHRYRSSSPSLQSPSLKDDRVHDNDECMKPSVAIIGTGAVGGYYGARLWESGKYDVKFQMRGENYDVSIRDGLRVDSIDGDIFIPPTELEAFTNPEDIGPVDWVIVSIKSSSLKDIPDLIYPLIDSGRTRILAIMNGLIEEDLIQILKESVGEDFCAALYGGMALVCSNKKGPGHISHSYAGLISGGVAISRENFNDQENQQAFRDLWAPTSIDIAYEESLLGGRWRKCLWNLPFNGISVAMNGITVDKIVNDPGLRRLATEIMDETVAVANADLAANGFGEEFYLNEEDKKKMMDLSDNMGAYRTSTMIDFVEGRPLEVHYMFTKPVERAQSLGVHVPYLDTIVTQIQALENLR